MMSPLRSTSSRLIWSIALGVALPKRRRSSRPPPSNVPSARVIETSPEARGGAWGRAWPRATVRPPGPRAWARAAPGSGWAAASGRRRGPPRRSARGRRGSASGSSARRLPDEAQTELGVERVRRLVEEVDVRVAAVVAGVGADQGPARDAAADAGEPVRDPVAAGRAQLRGRRLIAVHVVSAPDDDRARQRRG